jgi:uncharacterized membrane protein
MDPSSLTLPGAVALGAWLVAVPILGVALARTRWRDASGGPAARVWPAALAALVVLWTLRGHAAPPFAFHLYGIAALTLLTGPSLALVGGAAVVACTFALGGAPWANAAATWLVAVAAPVAVTVAVLRAVERMLPANFFVYVFAVAFFGAGLSYVAAGAAGLALMVACSDVTASLAFGEYLLLVITLAFGEAILSGMALTLAAVYRPSWVATFDASRYFAR